MALIWLPETKADIQRLFDFLADVNPTAAAKAIRLIRTGADRLRDHPRLGRPMQDGLCRELYLPFAGGVYILRYRLEATPSSSSASGMGASRAAEHAPPDCDASAGALGWLWLQRPNPLWLQRSNVGATRDAPASRP